MTSSSSPKLLALLGMFCALVTTIGYLSSEPVMLQCTKHCWLKSLLYAIFGESGAKIMMLIIGYIVSLAFFYGAFSAQKKGAGADQKSDNHNKE